MRCEDPESVLESVRAKLAWSKRPRIDIIHMKPLEDTIVMASEEKPDLAAEALTTAAQAIGTTLGKLAVRTGLAKAPVAAKKPAKKNAPAKKKAAAKKTGGAKPKARTAAKKPVKKTAKKTARTR